MWIIFLLIAAAVVYFIVRNKKKKTSGSLFKEAPLDILKRPHAEGDITEDESESGKDHLE